MSHLDLIHLLRNEYPSAAAVSFIAVPFLLQRIAAMPLELLREISKKALPLTIDDAAVIDKLRVLRAAGYVAVLLPKVGSDNAFARVLAITKDGREALKVPDDTVGT